MSASALDNESKVPGFNGGGEPIYLGLQLSAWIKIGIVAVLMAMTFRFNLVRLWAKTNPFFGEPNWRHAICIPLIGIYYLYVNRDDVLKAPVRTAWSGLGILLFGILTFAYGIYPGQNDFLKDLGMVVTLFGVVALLAGWQVLKVAWFPILFLVCALPWPELVYSKVAWPLQRLAASVAVGALRYTGVDAFNTGTKIIISAPGQADRTLNVAEACAGLRSLMTFISVAAAVAFLSFRPFWQKIVVTLSAVPIAVFCNVMRVSGQGLLDHYWSQELAEGFAHQFVGIIMLVPGFFLILLTGWMLDKVFIEEAGSRAAAKGIVRAGSAKPVSWSIPPKTLRGRSASASVAQVNRPSEMPPVNGKPVNGTGVNGASVNGTGVNGNGASRPAKRTVLSPAPAANGARHVEAPSSTRRAGAVGSVGRIPPKPVIRPGGEQPAGETRAARSPVTPQSGNQG